MDNDPFEADRLRRLRQCATDCIEAFAEEVISFLKSQPACLAPEDLGLSITWEEYAVQIAGEESFDFEVYRDTVRDLAQGVAAAAPVKDLELCALFCESYIDWWFDQDDPSTEALPRDMVEWLVNDIEQAVNRHAEKHGDVINERIHREFGDLEDDDADAADDDCGEDDKQEPA